jgi:hypothetical protein
MGDVHVVKKTYYKTTWKCEDCGEELSSLITDERGRPILED